MRRPALIFDFGNVVAHFDYRKACARLGGQVGLSGEEFLERVRSRGFGPLVQEYERGRITAEEFSRDVCALVGLEIAHKEFAAAWSDIFTLNEPVDWLLDFLWGNEYPLILGSNTNDLHAAQFRAQFATTLNYFDHLVLSFEIGHIKPAPEFYLACAEAAEAPPAECVFIDDLAENVQGAIAVGMNGVLFTDVPALRLALKSLGVWAL